MNRAKGLSPSEGNESWWRKERCHPSYFVFTALRMRNTRQRSASCSLSRLEMALPRLTRQLSRLDQVGRDGQGQVNQWEKYATGHKINGRPWKASWFKAVSLPRKAPGKGWSTMHRAKCSHNSCAVSAERVTRRERWWKESRHGLSCPWRCMGGADALGRLVADGWRLTLLMPARAGWSAPLPSKAWPDRLRRFPFS